MNFKTLIKNKAFQAGTVVTVALGTVIVILLVTLKSSDEKPQAPGTKGRREDLPNFSATQKPNTRSVNKPSKKNRKIASLKDESDEEEEENPPDQGTAQESKTAETSKRTTPSAAVKKRQESEEKATLVSKEKTPTDETKKYSQVGKGKKDQLTPIEFEKKDQLIDSDKKDQLPSTESDKKDPSLPVESNKKDHLVPIESYFDLPTPKQPTTKLLKVDDVKDWDEAKLKSLHDRLKKEMDSYDYGSIAHKICQANLELVEVFIFNRSSWGTKIYNEWVETGFKGVGCPEFISLVEHECKRSSDDSNLAFVTLNVTSMHNHMQYVIDRTVPSDTGEHAIQALMIKLVGNSVRLTEPGTNRRNSLFQFARTGKVDDAKTFFASMGPLTDPNFVNFSRFMFSLFYAPMKSEAGFALNLLIIMHEREVIKNLNIRNETSFENDLILKDNQSLDEAYAMWLECRKKNVEADCLKRLQELTQESMLIQMYENVEKAFKSYQDSGRCEQIDVNFTKGALGKYMALRAYVGLRKYLKKVKISDLESVAKSEFGFAQLPPDRSCLGADTFKKNPRFHSQLSNYYRARLCEKTWKTWEDIFESFNADAEEEIITDAIDKMGEILQECKPGGKCKIDVQGGKISCTSDAMNEDLSHSFANFKKEEAAFFVRLLNEAMQFKDNDKALEYLNTELILVQSSREKSLCPPINFFSISFGNELKIFQQYGLPFANFV